MLLLWQPAKKVHAEKDIISADVWYSSCQHQLCLSQQECLLWGVKSDISFICMLTVIICFICMRDTWQSEKNTKAEQAELGKGFATSKWWIVKDLSFEMDNSSEAGSYLCNWMQFNGLWSKKDTYLLSAFLEIQLSQLLLECSAYSRHLEALIRIE